MNLFLVLHINCRWWRIIFLVVIIMLQRYGKMGHSGFTMGCTQVIGSQFHWMLQFLHTFHRWYTIWRSFSSVVYRQLFYEGFGFLVKKSRIIWKIPYYRKLMIYHNNEHEINLVSFMLKMLKSRKNKYAEFILTYYYALNTSVGSLFFIHSILLFCQISNQIYIYFFYNQ